LKSNAQVAVIRPRFLSSQHQANQFTAEHASQNKQITGMIVMVAATMKVLARNRSGQDEETTGKLTERKRLPASFKDGRHGFLK
jgi:hypothetical protein